MLAASRAAWVPSFMAMPTSAWASAGASLAPSPHMATRRPSFCSWRMRASFFSGVASASTSSTPASAAMAAAVSGLSPVTITVRMPSLRSSAKRSRIPGLTTSLRWITPSRRLSTQTSKGVPPLWAILSTSRASGAGISRRCRPTKASTESTAPLRNRRCW
ncbi:hypothetical protein D3C81_1201370 [compost metagenome]